MANFEHAFGTHSLKLLQRHQQQQQAFNQADSYALQVLADINANANATIINDEHGALAVALQEKPTTLINDYASYQHKLALNLGKAAEPESVLTTDAIANEHHETALVKLPKNLAYFRYLLQQLTASCDTVIVTGMQKYWPKAFYQCAYDYYASVEVLPGVKKAKAMVLRQGKKQSLEPQLQTVVDNSLNVKMLNYPGVFSAEKLDIGSRFLLENFPNLTNAKTVLDLGAGNGILGLFGKRLFNYNLIASDDFYLAKQSAFATAKFFTDSGFKHYHHAHCLYGLEDIKADAILCNPPFHQGHSVSDHIAKTLFKQSASALNPGGSLYVVANKHLAYKPTLKKYFDTVAILNQNNKFLIYQATKA